MVVYRSALQPKCLQAMSKYIQMIQNGTPDIRSLRVIQDENGLREMRIYDFQIFDGKRFYKFIWRQTAGGLLRYKWEPLENLQDFMEAVYRFEVHHRQQIRAIQRQWEQYLYDGRTSQPYVYFDVEKARRMLEEAKPEHNYQSSDSSYRIAKKRKNQKFSILPNKKTNKKTRKRLSRRKRKKISAQDQSEKEPLAEQSNQKIKQESDAKERQKNESRQLEQVGEIKQEKGEEQTVNRNVGDQREQQIRAALHKALQLVGKTVTKEGERSCSEDNKQLGGEEDSIEQIEFQERQPSQNGCNPIYSSEQSQQKYEEVVFVSESSEESSLRHSNVRQFVMQKMRQLEGNSWFQQDDKESISSSEEKANCVENPQTMTQPFSKIKENASVKNAGNNKRIVEYSRLDLDNILQQIDLQSKNIGQAETDNSDQRYVRNNLIACEGFFPKRARIVSINRAVEEKEGMRLYSVNVGTAYCTSQKFVLEACLQQYYPALLSNFRESSI